MTIGKRLKQIRTTLGYTQAETAKKVGAATRGVIANWEADKTTPRPHFIQAYSDAFGVPVNWFKYGPYDEYAEKVMKQVLNGQSETELDYRSFFVHGADMLGITPEEIIKVIKEYMHRHPEKEVYEELDTLQACARCLREIVVSKVHETIKKGLGFKNDFDIDFVKLNDLLDIKSNLLMSVLNSIFCDNKTQWVIKNNNPDDKNKIQESLNIIKSSIFKSATLPDEFMKLNDVYDSVEIALLFKRKYARNTVSGLIEDLKEKLTGMGDDISNLLSSDNGEETNKENISCETLDSLASALYHIKDAVAYLSEIKF